MTTGRINLALGSDLMDLLELQSKKMNISKTQVIKEALLAYANTNHLSDALQNTMKYAGLFKTYSLNIDPVEFQRTQRDEWV